MIKNLYRNLFSSLPFGARVLLLLYALGYPLALLGDLTNSPDLYGWLALFPPLVWKGEVWSLVTYAFLPCGPLDWAVSLFWLATLIGVVGRNWPGREIWIYCLLATVVCGLFIVLVKPGMDRPVAGNAAMIFALLAAWYRLYGRERLILLGLGEISVRQAVGLVLVIEVLVLFFSFGWFLTLAMMLGGVVGWLYLVAGEKHAHNRRSQAVDSERITRLEL